MKITLKTSVLQQMVGRSVKGASCNKMIPITELMAIQLKNNVLTLITSDATNYLYIRQDKVQGDDFYVVVRVETFAKLISKMTSEDISIELLEDKLQVVGNGKYFIELPLDEEGQLIKYPDPAHITAENKIITKDSPVEIHLSTIRTVLTTNKAALATTMESPCYTGYYVGDEIVSTDTYKICATKVKLFETPVLISPEMMNLLDIMTEEKIKVSFASDNELIFDTPDCVVYGTVLEGIEDYAITAINALVNEEFHSMCKIPKSAFLGVLDRLSLFVSVYDKNEIYLTFTRDGLLVSSKQSSGTEIIKYSDSKNFKDYTCAIDIGMLTTQVKAQTGDMVELWYGEENAIKMIDGNIIQIVALSEDDRWEEE